MGTDRCHTQAVSIPTAPAVAGRVSSLGSGMFVAMTCVAIAGMGYGSAMYDEVMAISGALF